MAIFASTIHDKIIGEIKKRELASQSPENDNFGFAGQQPFIILESNAVKDGNNDAAKKNILYGGSQDFFRNIQSGVNDLLVKTDLGYRPHYGITSITVNNKGTLGSIREATINFECWDLNQLELMQKLYMNPGVYLYLQWGYYDMEKVLPIQSILSLNPNSIKNLLKRNEIYKEVINSEGRYDAMVGPCSKFTWKLNQTGGFECSTTIISPASFVFSIPLNSPDNDHNIFYTWISDVVNTLGDHVKDPKDETVKNEISKLGEYDSSIVTTVESTFTDKKNMTDKFFGEGSEYYRYIGHSSTQILTDIPDNKYISFGHLCSLINNCLFFSRNKEETIQNILNSRWKQNYSSINSQREFEDRGICYINLNTPNAVCKNHHLLRSCKPDDVLIVNEKSENNLVNRRAPSLHSRLEAIGLSIDIIKFNTEKPDGCEYSDITNGEFTFGKIKNIFINLKSVVRIAKESHEVYELIDKFLDLINSSVSNFFTLTRDVDDNNALSINIVDSTLCAAQTKVNVFTAYAVNSIIKDVTLDATLSSKFQTAAYVSNTDGNSSAGDINVMDAFSKFYDGFTNGDIGIGKRALSKEETEQEKKENKKKKEEEEKKNKSDKINMRVVLDSALHIDLASHYDGYWSILKKAAQSNDVTPIGPPIGINLKLSMKGISGIYYGNLFNISYSPSYLKKNVCFQITNVTHTVDSSGWNLSLDSLLRPMYGVTTIPFSMADIVKEAGVVNLFTSANRDLNSLQPEMKRAVEAWLEKCEKENKKPYIVETIRSYERSDALFAQGRTTLGKIVTNAKGGFSNHNFGFAVDAIPYNSKNKPTYDFNPMEPNWQRVVALAESCGLEWGGKWVELKDYPHFQLKNMPTLAESRKNWKGGYKA